MRKPIGEPLDRVDGRLKVTGGARYSAEIPVRNPAHAVLVGATIAHGRMRTLDTRRAESAPGVLRVITYRNAGKLARPTFLPASQTMPILQSEQILYAGQPIAVVVADTLEHAEGAARLISVQYDAQPHDVVLEENQDKAFAPATLGFRPRSPDGKRGDIAAGLDGAATKIDHLYTTPFEHHNALEPHSTTAVWNGDELTLYDATQNVNGVRQAVSEIMGISQERVRVVSHFLGGGFGSKGLAAPHVILTALAARQVGRPVKLMLSRQQMFYVIGHRPVTRQQVALGADAQGKLSGTRHNTLSHTSQLDEFLEPSGLMTEMMYECPNLEVTHRLARLNTNTPIFTRAPGEASGSFALESAMDELAYELKLDPIELRLRNYAEQDPQEKHPWSSKSLRQCYEQGRERFNWSARTPEPRSMRQGDWLIGFGMATATYPANFRAASARATMFADGRVLVQSAAHDIGTGCYTVMTQLSAEVLGVDVSRVRFELGDTKLPFAPGAGGSNTTASVGSAVQAAAQALRQRVIGMATSNESSPLSNLPGSQIQVENGRAFDSKNPSRGETYVQILARQNTKIVEARGDAQPGRERGGASGSGSTPGTEQSRTQQSSEAQDGVYSFHSFGAHFIEARVHANSGEVRIARGLGIYGAGRILNEKTATSQMKGGMVWGIGMALHEETVMDARYGRFVNDNLAEYHVPTNADIPLLEVVFVPEEDKWVNPIGVKGIGEIGIVGVAAAVANAIYHATGKRIRDLPITPDKLL